MSPDVEGSFPPEETHFKVPPVPQWVRDEEAKRVLDASEGIRLREEAIEQVHDNADESWKKCAYDAWMHVLRTSVYTQIITDPVWETMEAWGVADETHDRRAMGPITRRVAAEGFIEKVMDASGNDVMRKSAMPQNHRRPMQVWRIVRRPEAA